MKKYFFILSIITFSATAFSQETTKEAVAKPDYSQEAIKYYFKSSESSHLSSKEQNWSFSFMSADKKKLQKFADELNKNQAKPKQIEMREGKYIFTLKERVKYNPETLFNRIQELNKLAVTFGIDSLTSFYVDTL